MCLFSHGLIQQTIVLLLGIHTSLARTEHALLEHVAGSHDLTECVGLRTLLQRHLEHGLMHMRVELLAHLAELAINSEK